MNKFKTSDFLESFRRIQAIHDPDLHAGFVNLSSSAYDDNYLDFVNYRGYAAREFGLSSQRLKSASEWDVAQFIDECKSSRCSPAVILDSMGSEVYLEES